MSRTIHPLSGAGSIFSVLDIQPLIVTCTPPILQNASDSPAPGARHPAPQSSGGNRSSYRDFVSTAATLPTTVLSETWKPIALFGHARGPYRVFGDSSLPD